MFVGDSNKGKTSLLLALTKKGRVNHYQEVKFNVNHVPLSTVGVDLGDWEYAKQTGLLSKTGSGAKKITFMTWDFGGQVGRYSYVLQVHCYNIVLGRVLCHSPMFPVPSCPLCVSMECAGWRGWPGWLTAMAGEY